MYVVTVHVETRNIFIFWAESLYKPDPLAHGPSSPGNKYFAKNEVEKAP